MQVKKTEREREREALRGGEEGPLRLPRCEPRGIGRGPGAQGAGRLDPAVGGIRHAQPEPATRSKAPERLAADCGASPPALREPPLRSGLASHAGTPRRVSHAPFDCLQPRVTSGRFARLARGSSGAGVSASGSGLPHVARAPHAGLTCDGVFY